MNVLLALIVGGTGVLEPAGVLDGDGLSDLGARASALGDDSLSDAHFV